MPGDTGGGCTTCCSCADRNGFVGASLGEIAGALLGEVRPGDSAGEAVLGFKNGLFDVLVDPNGSVRPGEGRRTVVEEQVSSVNTFYVGVAGNDSLSSV